MNFNKNLQNPKFLGIIRNAYDVLLYHRLLWLFMFLLRDVSLILCVCVCVGGGGGGGCNFPAEIVSKNFLPPAEYTLKIAPPRR